MTTSTYMVDVPVDEGRREYFVFTTPMLLTLRVDVILQSVDSEAFVYAPLKMVDSTFQFILSSFSGIQWNPVQNTSPGGDKRTQPYLCKARCSVCVPS